MKIVFVSHPKIGAIYFSNVPSVTQKVESKIKLKVVSILKKFSNCLPFPMFGSRVLMNPHLSNVKTFANLQFLL